MAFDKGGLDALMGDEGADANAAGTKLLSEVARVVDSRAGAYLCVTLAQEHVLRGPLLPPARLFVLTSAIPFVALTSWRIAMVDALSNYGCAFMVAGATSRQRLTASCT